jgi:hypothetical protein
MMQLYCPACENVVFIEHDDGEEFVPCPSCNNPIYWLERRKARPATEPSDREPRIFAAPARVASPTRVPASAPAQPALERAVPKDGASEGDLDFSVPCPDPEASRFVALPYRAEGGVHPSRLPLFIVGVLASGVGIGAVASVLGQTCYLILLFPLVMGMTLAGLTIVLSHRCHVRSPLVAGMTAFVAGALAILMMHYLDYRSTLALVEGTPEQLPRGFVSALQRSPGMLAYLQATAREGLTISGRDGDGLNLGQIGTYAYWGIEVLLVVLIASIGGATGARDPYCSLCRGWKEDRFLGTLADGGVQQRRLIERGSLWALTCYRPTSTSGPLVLSATVCPRCGCEAPVDLRVEWNPRVRRMGASTILPIQLTYPGEALPILEKLFTPKK